ncbi:hypothetical protein [Spirosoma sp. KUDC1026]|uniref:hypothetical protein n=1 Tax=Spirosoma sp. KUDC1026 TaxID=2745947 RepID=UPI00159BCE06|nr:hypothetical protein [Spirosoma sp. KUDC1026]QKZ14091.1 hypothetical protein HU175_16220 [Spirosoma sp. KUDC1026]
MDALKSAVRAGRLVDRSRRKHIAWTFHPTPTGVDGGRETRLNTRTCDLYTPVWLG